MLPTMFHSHAVPALSQVQISFNTSTQQSGRQYGCPGDLAVFTFFITNAPSDPDQGNIEVEVLLPAEAQSSRTIFTNEFTASIFSNFSAYLIKNIGVNRSIVINYIPLPTSNLTIYCTLGGVTEEVHLLIAGENLKLWCHGLHQI